jgi:ABC-type polysaccharide/polyol phosphate transport system ATPase subunit
VRRVRQAVRVGRRPALANNGGRIVNDIAIRAVDLRKVYRLYAKPSYRFLDMFGLLGNRPGAFTEHAALDGVDLEIRRGEKVAVIGRNGAGKSTFLKLVTNVIQPTAGTLEVQGDVHALLQIGTGFHPDFTGRENVYAYFAQLGVTGAEADRRCVDVVEFAELEEYIDQPVKTYSTGMAVRLMFSVSTAITPDLLVLDEVLGVGDAYFSQKSFDRIRELCEKNGTTLLLVTHDIYSAIKLCRRVVWIERGRILLDGDSVTVVKAYEDSIRQQEEQRLRLKKQQRLSELSSAAPRSHRIGYVLVEIASRNGQPQPGVVYFSAMRLLVDGAVVSELPLEVSASASQSHLELDGSSWGDPIEWEGRTSRPFLNFGTSFHKIAGVFAIPGGLPDLSRAKVVCAFDYAAPDGCDLAVRVIGGQHRLDFGTLTAPPTGWSHHDAAQVEQAPPAALQSLNISGIHGNGAIVVQDARFVSSGIEQTILTHGDRVALEIDYHVRDTTLIERPQVVVALQKDGVQDVCRYFTRALALNGVSRHGRVTLTIPRLSLTNGTYAVTIMIAKEGYYDREQTVFFSINPEVYCCVSRLFDVSVIGAGLIGSGTLHVFDGEWCVQ